MQLDFELQNFQTAVAQNVDQLLQDAPEGMFREAAFLQTGTEYFAEAKETGNVQICTSVHRNRAHQRMRQINGYAIWDDFETLDLFVAEFRGEGIYALEKAKVTAGLNLGYKYYRYLQQGDDQRSEESSAERELINNYMQFREQIMRVRIILLTDGVVRHDHQLPNTAAGEDLIFEVWDLQRMYEVWSAQGRREPIEIDLPEQFGCRLPYLMAEQKADQYTAYLTIAPASLLADLYHAYGTRLLEQNVRVYLQNLGKVNREMRKTIINAPGMFMAYNNGISATASSVTFDQDPVTGQSFIRHLSDLQIVNGGQTTSSIFYARRRDRADISAMHVQLKITCVSSEKETDDMVSMISKYANSQNRVSEIDLTSNHPYQIRLEELSRTTWASAADRGTSTRWYYERVKGQYKEELNKVPGNARKNTFKEKNPPSQIIRKEEFAKYRNAWNMQPQVVARGSQKNYLQFIATEHQLEPDRDYFRETVAIMILFKAAEQLYGKKPNAMGDLRYLAVPYALAWLNHHTGQRIALQQIWAAQQISGTMSEVLRQCLLRVNQFLQDERPEAFTLVGEWAKRDECWEALVARTPAELGIDTDLISGELHERQLTAAHSRGASQVAGSGIAEWENMEIAGKERHGLDLFQLNVIRNVIRRLKTGKPLTDQLENEAAAVLEAYRRAAG